MLEHDPAPFPEQDGLNIAALTGLFRNTTNSYKFVFFLALLELLKRHQFDPERPYPYTEITIEMLSAVWFAHTFFKLSFGAQDMMTQKLDALGLDFQASESLPAREQVALRRVIAASDLNSALELMRYVPYRLMRPFVESSLTQEDKGQTVDILNAIVVRCVNKQFDRLKPLYQYDNDDRRHCSAIHWHPDWVRYLEQHHGIIHGWTSWHWLAYMQRRNPNTPGLPNKLFPPSKRESLNKQSRYWREILNAAGDKPLTCIYTGEPLSPKHFALDHYLPWSFVVHDQLWNLIPAPPAVNASKSNQIPSGDHLRDLVDLQYDGLQIARRIFSPREFDRFTEDYIADLHLPSTETLLNYGELFNAYARTVEPLVTLATNQGFTSGWAYGSDDH